MSASDASAPGDPAGAAQTNTAREAPEGRPPVVLQVLPALDGGGVERGTVDIAAALGRRRAGARWWRPRAGPWCASSTRAGVTHVELPLASKNPFVMRAQHRAHRRADRRARRRHRPCPLARAGLERRGRGEAHRRALRHHFSRHLRRQPVSQALLQCGDGARRARDRHLRVHRASRRPSATRSSPRACAIDPARRRRRPVRSRQRHPAAHHPARAAAGSCPTTARSS